MYNHTSNTPRVSISTIVILFLLGNVTNAARILAVFPFPGISSQLIIRDITLELERRGHDLVIFTTNPINDPKLRNYTEFSLHSLYEWKENSYNFAEWNDRGYWTNVNENFKFHQHLVEETLSHLEMQRLISSKSTEKFDVILLEHLWLDALVGLSVRFDAPLIEITFLPVTSKQYMNLGDQMLCAYSPDGSLHYSDEMNFWERINNCYTQIRFLFENYYSRVSVESAILKKHFGENMLHVSELPGKIDMLLVLTEPYLDYQRPHPRNIVYIGGVRRIEQKIKELPPDLKRFMDGAKSGFIYFSLGSNVLSNGLLVETRNTLLRAFSKLPYRVIWKWENDVLPGKPSNVFISKWLPQQQILLHPNILLFFYHGGVSSTQEAIENGVPLLGAPFFADQEYNVNRMVTLGVAKKIYIKSLNDEEIRNAILEVAINSTYKERMLELRHLLHDRMHHPMEEAMFWIEHVIRHRGAHHLRPRSRDMPIYQIELWDIVAFCIAALMVMLCVTYKAVRYCIDKLWSLQFREKVKIS